MKTLKQIDDLMRSFEKRTGMIISGADQGSQEWLNIKLGVLSASNASKIVAKKDSETRNTYMSELVAQVATGIMEEFNSKYTEWGHLHENAARSSYEFESGFELSQVPFIFKDESFREGCSLDSIANGKIPVEIKCPYNSVHYVKFFCDDKIKPEYVWQYQYQMRVTGADIAHFVQYDPRMKSSPLKIVEVARDAEKQSMLDEAVPSFISDMDRMLAKIGVEFGDQWRRLAVQSHDVKEIA